MFNSLLDDIADATSAVVEPLTVEQYHAMIRQGILVEGAPIELIDGVLVRNDRRDKGGGMMTVRPRHTYTILTLDHLLSAAADQLNAHVRAQQPVTLDGGNEPEPDLSVALGQIDDDSRHHPGPGAIALVVDVADNSLTFDRGEKFRKYAAAGISCDWIINLNDEVVEVYSRPQPQQKRYAGQTSLSSRDSVTFEIEGQTIELAVDDILA